MKNAMKTMYSVVLQHPSNPTKMTQIVKAKTFSSCRGKNPLTGRESKVRLPLQCEKKKKKCINLRSCSLKARPSIHFGYRYVVQVPGVSLFDLGNLLTQYP